MFYHLYFWQYLFWMIEIFCWISNSIWKIIDSDDFILQFIIMITTVQNIIYLVLFFFVHYYRRWWRWRLFVLKTYENCCEFSLTMINSIVKHLLIFSWFYMIQFIYDLIFWMNVWFSCSWWIIILRLRRRIQMRYLFFDLRNVFECLVLWLISASWNLRCFSSSR